MNPNEEATISPVAALPNGNPILEAETKSHRLEDFKNQALTDLWNSRIFLADHGKSLRYCPSFGWLRWDGTKWEMLDKHKVTDLAAHTIESIKEMAKFYQSNSILKHAQRTEAEGRLKSMVSLAKGRCLVDADELDSDTHLLNVKNGMMDLDNLEVLPHDRSRHITRKIELDYDPGATAPVWEAFLYSIFEGDEELIRFMQKAIGYSLTGDNSEQCMFILYGVGMNGKSTFLTHIYNLLGDYSANINSSSLMRQFGNSIPNDIARLKGSRFVSCSESNQGLKLDEAKIKNFTGNEPITARYLHKEFFEFIPTFKIFMATNTKPEISGTDKGIWRRIRAIPFNKVISAEERDNDLDKKLVAEYPGILNWAIDGLRLWKTERLGMPKAIADHTAQYQADSDILGSFITEKCVVDADESVTCSALLAEAQVWLKANGIKQVKRNKFIDYLNSKGFENCRQTTRGDENHGRWVWKGIAILSDKNVDKVVDQIIPF